MPLDVPSTARDDLARLRDEISAAQHKRARAQEAVDRLERPHAEVLAARAEHAALKAEHDAAIVVWYESGCSGGRPEMPLKMLHLEHEIGDLTRNLGAVEDRLQAAQEALQRANEDLAILSGEHRSRVYGAVVEAARDRLQRYTTPAMVHSMLELSIVQALPPVLRGRSDPEAMSAAHRIDEMIMVARSSIGVRCDLEPARRFLIELEHNPDAELSDAGEPTIEALDPPIIKPMEDWSRYINRGSEPAPQADQPFLPNPATADPGVVERMFWRNPQREAVMRAEAGCS